MGSQRVLEDKGLGDLERYMGFLKCLYVAGMVGGNAGYYAYPEGGFDESFPEEDPPHWIMQMIVLSRVHAFFSHFEDTIRHGELLPGPRRHVWSKEQPAYEFPTGDANVRVLVRQRQGDTACLVAAWAAGGNSREVSVDIPKLGAVTLLARPGGSVYLAETADGEIAAQLKDVNALLPSQSMKSSSVP